MEIRTFKILLTLLGLLLLVTARPAQLEGENNSEIGDADYESSDDSETDEYLQEDEATDEVPQNRNDVSEGQELKQNLKLLPDQGRSRNRYEELSEKSYPDRQRRGEIIGNKDHLKTNTNNDYSVEEEDAQKMIKDTDQFKKNPELGDTNIKGKPFTSDYAGEHLFKVKQDGYNTDRSEYINDRVPKEQSRRIKEQQYSYEFGNRDIRSKNYDHAVNRDRRNAPSIDVTEDNASTPSEKQDVDTKNDNSESSIIKNIKKLSDQDLEELLNSLPEDKKAILKKIMEKREITKKAGAVEENYLEGGQSDTNKNDGGFLLDSSTNSELPFSSSTDTTEVSKHTESGDVDNTKNAENENIPGKSDGKTLLISSKDSSLNVEIESGNSNSYVNGEDNLKDEELMKNENKREITKADYTNEDITLDNSADNSDHLDLKDELCFNNEEFPNQNGDDFKPNTHKREIIADDSNEVRSSLQSLEESFSSDTTGESLSPLIRVKRTEKDRSCNKRDTNILSNVKVPFSPRVDSGGAETEERSEIEDYGFLDRTANYARNVENTKLQNKIPHETFRRLMDERDLKFNQIEHSGKDINVESGKACLGSDTDSVLSSVEGVDDNLMYNSGIRNKRTEELIDLDSSDDVKLSRSGRTADDLNNVVSDNSINVPNGHEEDAFGPVSRNYEGDNIRLKRIRQIKQAPLP